MGKDSSLNSLSSRFPRRWQDPRSKVASPLQTGRRSAPACSLPGGGKNCGDGPKGLGEQTQVPCPLQTWGARTFFRPSRGLGLVPENQGTPWSSLPLSRPPEPLTPFIYGQPGCVRDLSFPNARTKPGSFRGDRGHLFFGKSKWGPVGGSGSGFLP